MNNFFKILKGVNFQLRIIYSVKVAIECETAIKTFSDFQGLKKMTFLAPFLKSLLKYLLHWNEAVIKEEEDFG